PPGPGRRATTPGSTTRTPAVTRTSAPTPTSATTRGSAARSTLPSPPSSAREPARCRTRARPPVPRRGSTTPGRTPGPGPTPGPTPSRAGPTSPPPGLSSPPRVPRCPCPTTLVMATCRRPCPLPAPPPRPALPYPRAGAKEPDSHGRPHPCPLPTARPDSHPPDGGGRAVLVSRTSVQQFPLAWPPWQPPPHDGIAVVVSPGAPIAWADSLLARDNGRLVVWASTGVEAERQGLTLLRQPGVRAGVLSTARSDPRRVGLALEVALHLAGAREDTAAAGPCLTSWSPPDPPMDSVRIPHLVTAAYP